MKPASICKSISTTDITDEQLEKIQQYSRRPLTREEVYLFTVILCDNEVDRDFERFPIASLETLAELYLGKTGVFDHTPTAENQSARIFDTQLVVTEQPSSVGEPYAMLKAWAYMVQCDKNADLILEIEAGIKKEVSVGCAVEQIVCSICGQDQRETPCAHHKGQTYEGMVCHHLLLQPSDAYEWSFVAVPAQKKAGVVKTRTGLSPHTSQETIDPSHLEKLKSLAALGDRYQNDLRKNVIRLGLLAHMGMDAPTLEKITAKLDAGELASLEKTFSHAACRHYPVSPQLAPIVHDTNQESAFQI